MTTDVRTPAPAGRRQLGVLLLAILIVPALYLVVVVGSVLIRQRAAPFVSGILSAPVAYIGADACIECHAEAYDAWRGSHHDLAMQPATEDTVLGDFNDATFSWQGVTTRFFRREGRYLIETQGPDSQQREYEVEYTFGAIPLQQYLISLPDGRRQAFTIAWDTRPEAEGGQRWFHLYPDEQTPPGDELHWAAPVHTWNSACAECHSTNLQKGYDLASDTYDTTWSEVNVSCEACHGPASRHAAIAAATDGQRERGYPLNHGLVIDLAGAGRWRLDPGAPVAVLEAAAGGASEVESCARCHSRRTQIAAEYEFAEPLSETHRVQLLGERYYFPDGQIRDEVFVYGSFRQSRMYHFGVTCSDCHEPHNLKLRAPGNTMCANCHAPDIYDTPDHHFHEKGTDGASCAECHMPNRTYMVVDPRRDHSIRIPRPDLSVAIGTPNACNVCHTEETAQWSLDAVEKWYGADRKLGHQSYGLTFHAARQGAAGAGDMLAELALDTDAPAIARATAIEELAGWLSPASLPAIEAGLAAEDPLMRRAAAEALRAVDPQMRWELVSPLLTDRVHGVRIAAAEALSDFRLQDVAGADRQALQTAFEEYLAAERLNADRAEHWVNLAGFHFRQGDIPEAERCFQEARRRDRSFVPIYVNQADMYRALGRDAEGERILREGLARAPQSAPLHFSLGLLLVRTGQRDAALGELAAASRLEPADPHLGYVYGVALDSTGQRPRAIEIWEDVISRHPNQRDLLRALAMALMESGEPARAWPHARRLAELEPDDPKVAALAEAIRRAATSQAPSPRPPP
ncbi:MAG: HEAT repeat domain-containing protein [Phycisphaerales bacterium JB039]